MIDKSCLSAARDRIGAPLRLQAAAWIWTIRVFIPTNSGKSDPDRRTPVAHQRTMLTHADIWNAVDRLAARAGLSASGLAKKAGLDPTTFNKSKRITVEGRPRWPSTESVAKALAATNVSIDTFVQLIEDAPRTVQSVPLLGLAQ